MITVVYLPRHITVNMKLLTLALAPLLVVALPSSPLLHRQFDDPQSVASCEETFIQCKTHAAHHHPGGMTVEQCKDERSELPLLVPSPR